jgi:hypothetical protein
MSMENFVAIVETWQLKRKPLAESFSRDGLREFAETHNALTKRMISEIGRQDPEFYSALLELSQHASTLTVGGKFFVNKVDRTNE